MATHAARSCAVEHRRSSLVLCYALIPVAWIMSLSLKKPEDIADGSFLPDRRHLVRELRARSSSADDFRDALRQLDRHRG